MDHETPSATPVLELLNTSLARARRSTLRLAVSAPADQIRGHSGRLEAVAQEIFERQLLRSARLLIGERLAKGGEPVCTPESVARVPVTCDLPGKVPLICGKMFP
jgi:hypothetical protein